MTKFIFLSEKHKKVYLDFYHNKNRKYAKLIKNCKTLEEFKNLSKDSNYKNWLNKKPDSNYKKSIQSGGCMLAPFAPFAHVGLAVPKYTGIACAIAPGCQVPLIPSSVPCISLTSTVFPRPPLVPFPTFGMTAVAALP